MTHGRFSQFDEDAYCLPEGMRRIAYDADTQRYTFRDHFGQLYQSAPGSEYGVLKPVTAPLPHRRNVVIRALPDPALRQWSEKPAKTFNDILPSRCITAAQSPATESTSLSPTRLLSGSSEKWAQAAMLPKMQDVAQVVRRHTTMRRRGPGGGVAAEVVQRTASFSVDEKRRLLEDDDTWEIVRKSDVPVDGRIARSKSEMRPSRYSWRK